MFYLTTHSTQFLTVILCQTCGKEPIIEKGNLCRHFINGKGFVICIIVWVRVYRYGLICIPRVRI